MRILLHDPEPENVNYKAITIDDDPLSILMVEKFCKKINQIDMERSYTDPVKGAASIETEKPDVVFLDIEMPKLNGLDILRSLLSNPKVIVMSSNHDLESSALELNAAGFIRKPANFEHFSKVVSKVLKDIVTV